MAVPVVELRDASPSRERLGRVVELLRGMEADPDERWTPPRRGRRPVVRPRPYPLPSRALWGTVDAEEPEPTSA
jgi:hypothetical protein